MNPVSVVVVVALVILGLTMMEPTLDRVGRFLAKEIRERRRERFLRRYQTTKVRVADLPPKTTDPSQVQRISTQELLEELSRRDDLLDVQESSEDKKKGQQHRL